ncbi:D-alanyl-D-alanine carboxypeptidase [Sphaerisporangium krabiense]|uniref:D-alanyl-D-alanine carboxypeptidase/D-alanyl-D-alanine-endopeptidase (Penicillin-binding protein 4) n=1 Tax=Sphaerisporangium krabiense TaxID=763782 RepID=A0A7W9DPV4_9ACTN|nr:D-alanyl-D-alanine carboxypeptidase/D-alanyl-D-alanine-endopeptidase [Sphaerisporangium krabiense]MBB5626753.1 D-alanyl-D-alanine carboxypeptidase/D-alanyl-D-alanine-endopeptidase (penicillin-binding protein 4) [Sphaerisporangium krabiense]GII63672.1 D-alanyl-D-alanine carboxypeptidase [Sphaerisporangium krabiense]
MVRHERVAAVATLALLQAFVCAVGAYVLAAGGVGADAASPPVKAATPTRAPVAIVTSGPVLAPAPDGSLPGKGTLAARLTRAMGDAALGRSVGAVVVDIAGGSVLYGSKADTGITPASTTKVVTAVAVLSAAGPDARIATRVVQPKPGVVTLVGGGDPTLASPKAERGPGRPRFASMATLAARTARTLKAAGVTSVTLTYDDSLYSGPRTAPGWKPGYVPEGSVAPVSALTMDEGRENPGHENSPRFADPSRTAAGAFAVLLAREGVKVGKSVKRLPAPAGAKEVARVESPAVYELVEHMLTESDNDLAEALAHLVALKQGAPGSFAGASKAVTSTLGRLGVAAGVQVSDGSGLSVRNRITPAALARLVALAASPANPHLKAVISGLPVAGFTGTLGGRYDKGVAKAAAGVVRAKTGTLNGVNTLTGLARTIDGRLVAFAFMADDVRDPAGAVQALDRLAATVSGCGCS